MKTVADFAPFVEIKAHSVPTANIHHAIRECVIEFMRMTRMAVDELYLKVPANETELVVQPKACHHLLQIEGIFVQPSVCGTAGRWSPDWEEIPHDEMRRQYGWWIDDVGGPNATVWLNPTSCKARTLCVRYSYAIKRDACDIPDWIYEDYAGAIADGALGYLHSNPMDEDASSTFSARMVQSFMTAVYDAKSRKMAQYRPRRLNMTNTQFFGG